MEERHSLIGMRKGSSSICICLRLWNADNKATKIFQQMQKLIQQAIPFDIITLSDALNNEKLIDQAGGLHYLAEIAKNKQERPSTPSTVSFYAL